MCVSQVTCVTTSYNYSENYIAPLIEDVPLQRVIEIQIYTEQNVDLSFFISAQSVARLSIAKGLALQTPEDEELPVLCEVDVLTIVGLIPAHFQ